MKRSSFAWRGVQLALGLGLLLGSAVAAPAPRQEDKTLLAELKTFPYRIVHETCRDGRWTLVRVDADGSNPTVLTCTPGAGGMYPHVSPDGTKICFVCDEGEGKARRRNVYLMNMDGSGRTRIAEAGRDPCWAPDGKSIMAWQKSLGNLIGPTIYPMSGRPRGRMHQYNVSEKVRFVTRTGSVICLSARVRGSSRTVYHLSPTGKAIYTKSGSFFPSAATPDGYLLCRTSRVPRRLFILDPSGKEIFSKQGAEYPTGTFVNGHEYLAIRSLPGHRELHATFFRVKDGKELCEIPSTCLRGACLIDGGRVLCYDPSEQLLTVYDLATGRRLRRTVLRHGERGSLKVTEARMENGAMLLTLRGSASGEGPLIYYKIELTEK